jgi:uncharacterized protein with PQ loop repeat
MINLQIFSIIAPLSMLLLDIGVVTQIRLIIKNKSCKDLSLTYYGLLAFADFSWTMYAVDLQNPFMIFTELVGLSLVIIIICLWWKYK